MGPAQRAWLAARLGFELTPDEEAQADQASWEQDVERKARGLLEYKKPQQALDAMLARPRWLQGSPLYLLAVQAWMAQSHWNEAAKAARRGFDSAADKRDRPMAMQLGLLGAAAEMRLGHYPAANGWLDEVTALAGERDDVRRLEVDLYRRAVALAGGNLADAAAVEGAFRERFAAMPEDQSARDPAVLAWLAGALGVTWPELLAKALRLIGLELSDAIVQRLVIALAEWDVAVSKEAGDPPGLLLRRIGVQPDPSASPSQMWRAYLYGSKPDGLGRGSPPCWRSSRMFRHRCWRCWLTLCCCEQGRERCHLRSRYFRRRNRCATQTPTPFAETASDVPATKSAMRLSGPQAKHLNDALVDAFALPEFDEMLKLGLGRNLVSLSNVVGLFPMWTPDDRRCWNGKVGLRARPGGQEARPSNAALASVASELGLGSQVSDEQRWMC